MTYGADDDLIQGAPRRSGGYGADDELVSGANSKKKRKTSQALGVYKGVMKPINNAAQWVEGGARRVGLPVDAINDWTADNLGMARSGEDAREAQADFIESTGMRPGKIGEFGGNILGTAAAAAVTRNPAVLGAMEGALLTDDPDDLGQVAFDAGGGALTGHYGAKVADKLVDVAAPVIDPAVRLLQRTGVRLTPGQVFGGAKKQAEDAAMSLPVAGRKIIEDRNRSLIDFDRGAANRALMPVGLQLPNNVRTGHDAVQFLENEATRRYQSILPRMQMQVDRRLMAGVQRAHQIAATLPGELNDQFNRIMASNMRFNAQGQTMGRPLVQMIRDVRDQAYGYLKSDTQAERTLGEALAAVDEGIRSSLRAQNPHLARELSATDRLYRGTRIVSDAASRATDGISGVAQLSQAVRRADPTKGARATGSGRAYMQDYSNAGARVIPSKLADSGTARRMKAGKPVEAVRGGLAGLKYDIDKALLPYTSGPRPQAVQDVAAFIRRHPGMKNAIASMGGVGLLKGLLDEEDER